MADYYCEIFQQLFYTLSCWTGRQQDIAVNAECSVLDSVMISALIFSRLPFLERWASRWIYSAVCNAWQCNARPSDQSALTLGRYSFPIPLRTEGWVGPGGWSSRSGEWCAHCGLHPLFKPLAAAAGRRLTTWTWCWAYGVCHLRGIVMRYHSLYAL